jgi:GNAT superfamily N-acetyltransferase
MSAPTIAPGLPDRFRPEAARLYFAAFWPKLRAVLGESRLDAVAAMAAPKFRAERVISAHAGETLLGVAGFQREGKGFADLGLGGFQGVCGRGGGLRRGLALGLLNRKERAGELLMDGICVAEAARGQGVGGKLLAAIEDEARRSGAATIRLDVIGANPRARLLYERQGYSPVATRRLGLLRPIFGFSASTEMHKPIGSAP